MGACNGWETILPVANIEQLSWGLHKKLATPVFGENQARFRLRFANHLVTSVCRVEANNSDLSKTLFSVSKVAIINETAVSEEILRTSPPRSDIVSFRSSTRPQSMQTHVSLSRLNTCSPHLEHNEKTALSFCLKLRSVAIMGGPVHTFKRSSRASSGKGCRCPVHRAIVLHLFNTAR